MRILITGGTGFIGSGLVQQLVERGDYVTVLSRSDAHLPTETIRYVSDLKLIGGDEYFHAFINLAGESIAAQRWSEQRKQMLVGSRVGVTRDLLALAQRLNRAPEVLLSASAIGIYGSQGDERLAENAPQQDCFSHRLCLAWEQEAMRFESLGCRVCLMRLGVVLSSLPGGALDELLKSARLGVASWLGSGEQYLSWVHLFDVHTAMLHLLDDPDRVGVFNVTAPEPVNSREFCDEVAAGMRLWLKLGVPGFVMRLLFGEMADELLLQGQRVIPRRLEEAGFQFRYPSLRAAMPELLNQSC